MKNSDKKLHELALKAKRSHRDTSVGISFASLCRFAELVAAEEREACAKVCDAAANNSFSSSGVVWGEKLARDIRARGSL